MKVKSYKNNLLRARLISTNKVTDGAIFQQCAPFKKWNYPPPSPDISPFNGCTSAGGNQNKDRHKQSYLIAPGLMQTILTRPVLRCERGEKGLIHPDQILSLIRADGESNVITFTFRRDTLIFGDLALFTRKTYG